MGLYAGHVYTGGLIFRMLIALHIWGAYIRGGGDLYTGGVLTGFYGIVIAVRKSTKDKVMITLKLTTLKKIKSWKKEEELMAKYSFTQKIDICLSLF